MSFKILSIDGGGTRGIIPAKLLDCMERTFGERVQNMFDLFAGTSTGGLLCLGLGAGLRPATLVDLYLQRAADIFHESVLDRASGLDEHLRADYQHRRFKRILEEIFGTRTLGDLQADKRFGQLGKEVMICSFDLNPDRSADRNRNYRPAIFHSAFGRDHTELLVDVALRTTSAPTYFPIYQRKYIDGGVAMNNPSMAAIAYAMNNSPALGEEEGEYLESGYKGLRRRREEISVLSLGTGTSNLNRIEPGVIRSGNWGNIQWIRYLPDLLTEGNVQSTIYYARHVLPDGHFVRIDPYFDDPAETDSLLANRKIPMDLKDRATLDAMLAFTERVFLRHKAKIQAFLEA